MTKNQRSDAQERAIPTTGMPLVIYVLMVGAFLAGTSEFVMAGLLPLIAADYGVSVAEMGLAITAFATGIVIGAPSMALLSARLPRRAILVMAMLGFAAGHVLAALAPSFGLLLAARFLTALATGAYWGVASLTAAAAAGRFASRALGLVLGGSMAAIVVGVPLGAFAGQSVGWRLPFWVIAGLGVGAAGMLARLVPSQPGGPRDFFDPRAIRSAAARTPVADAGDVHAGHRLRHHGLQLHRPCADTANRPPRRGGTTRSHVVRRQRLHRQPDRRTPR